MDNTKRKSRRLLDGIFFLARLTEMNPRRFFEAKVESKCWKNIAVYRVLRTFETQNKGWSKWFVILIPRFQHFCLFCCPVRAFPAINKWYRLDASQCSILLWITISIPEKAAVFARSPRQSSFWKPIDFIVLAGLHWNEFVRIQSDILGRIDGIFCKHDTSPWQITCDILS